MRPVREALCSLGLRHRLVSCARGSANRDRLYQLTGRFQAPYLQDPNTGVSMFESGEIVKYLTAAYSRQVVHAGAATVTGAAAAVVHAPAANSGASVGASLRGSITGEQTLA